MFLIPRKVKERSRRMGATQRRFAWAQPRVLAALMVLVLGGGAWWATAQNSSSRTPATQAPAASAAGVRNTTSAKNRKPLSLADLPGAMQAYGQARRLEKLTGVTNTTNSTTGESGAASVGTRRFSLTETDLTPGNISDEREPEYRPSGDFIAFMSNGVDAVNNVTGAAVPDGKIDRNATVANYHIWIMRRDGTGQRQITGFGPDTTRDQRSPSWSPDGNRIVYTDGNATGSQLFIVSPFSQDPTTGKPPVQQLTFFTPAGKLRDPAWGSSGAIAFASDVVPGVNNATTPTPNRNYDIFSIDPSGSALTLRRLTGGTGDALGNQTNDWAPAFSLLNVGVMFFSSNRGNSSTSTSVGVIPGRRIWAMGSIDGGNKRQISDPLATGGGYTSDVDDNPAPSLQLNTSTGTRIERVAYERTRRIDPSDQTRDLNIWSLPVNSSQLAPPPAVPQAGVTVAGSRSNNVRDYAPANGAFRRDVASQLLLNPQDLVYGPDRTNDGYPELYVTNANRLVGANRGTVEIFNGITGQLVQTVSAGVTGTFANPTGITVGPDNFIYVSTTSGNIYRFNPLAPGIPVPVVFAGTAGVVQGITFGSDFNGDLTPDLYAAVPNGGGGAGAILVFSGTTGLLLGNFLQANTGGLLRPYDIKFGRDANGDRISDVYVLSNGTDSVKIYDGNTAPTNANRGTFLSDLVVDPSLIFPTRIAFGNDANRDGAADLYVSDTAIASINGPTGTVNRYSGRDGTPLPAPNRTGAIFISDPRLDGPTGITLNPIASGAYRPVVATTTPVETATNPAVLETNLLSSPNALRAARFTGAIEDKSADREPAFARSSSTNQIVSQLVFASQRKVPSAPASTPANPAPPEVNPGGGPQYVKPPALTPETKFTHDIWTTGVEDTTPPVVVPQAVGGQLYPALAPGVQAPFTAPRTAEEGLSPGSRVTVAFVVQELESGLRSARIQIKDADRPTFTTFQEDVNYPVNPDLTMIIETAMEQQPEVVASTNPVNGRPLQLRIYDDGPISAGGHERQFGAIRGDGIYYCEASFATLSDAGSPLTGDYYIDLFLTDNAGNAFTFDNVYGFSTRAFAKNNKVLLVSDFTVGQQFPILLSGLAPRSGIPALPVESYYLTNPGGTSINPPGLVPADLVVPFYGNPDTTSLGSFVVDPVTGQSDYADVWRILSRGPIPLDRLLLYSPQITEQLAPNQDPDGDGIPGPYRQEDGSLFPNVTRQTAVASSCVVWASPYTGDVFAGPGTLYDGSTQRDLTSFLNTGGRLFVSGQDVAFALSNNGTVGNDFLQNELKASYVRETGSPLIDGTNDPFIVNGNAVREAGLVETPDLLEIPVGPRLASGQAGATYGDAANNQQGMDVIAPVGAGGGETVTALYNYRIGGGLAGHRVEKVRAGGLESRLVFFSFGYEAVHRRYKLQNDPNPSPLRCDNVRSKIFYNMTRIYFYTGGISGRVISAATNQPIPGFLIEVVSGNNQLFVAETDSNGEYEILGIPFGSYTVRPLQYNDNGTIRSANGSFFPGPAQGAGVRGGEITRDVNFRIQPAPPGSISGRAISDRGTTDPADDATPAVAPAVNLPVLIRSVRALKSSASFPQGGVFAAITVTDGAGRFTFRNVPSNEHYELVFNPRPGFTNATNPAQRGDIPPNSGIVYPNPDPAASPQPNMSFERRVIPIDPAYGRDFTHPSIRQVADATGTLRSGFLVPIGQDLDIGDVPVPPGNGPDPGTDPGGGGGGGGNTDEFQIGSVYMISIPWMDSSALSATTTPAKAFSVPPTDTRGTATTTDDIVNYRLTKFDPLTQKYVTLGNNDTLRRGEGYFIRPVAKSVSLKRPPAASPSRVPLSTGVNTFTITLRRSPSLSPTDPNNGFNLIGFPFNPTTYKSVNWSVSRVFVPATNSTYSSLTAAVAAGVLSGNLQTLADNSGSSYINTTKMVPLKGYFAKTFMDNVQVTLVASTSP